MIKKCLICQKEFSIIPSHINKRITCSKKCFGIWFTGFRRGQKHTEESKKKISRAHKKGKFFNCLMCHKQFWRKPFEIKTGHYRFCSLKCFGKWQSKNKSGTKSPHWKGGISKSGRIIEIHKYKQWRKSVFERDGYQCVICGKIGGSDLNAHHIKSWKDFPLLRFDISNGITLCINCHRIGNKKLPLFFIKTK